VMSAQVRSRDLSEVVSMRPKVAGMEIMVVAELHALRCQLHALRYHRLVGCQEQTLLLVRSSQVWYCCCRHCCWTRA
jgi:hypothetical protein